MGIVILWLLVLAEGLALIMLMREIGRIHLRLGSARGARVTEDGPDVGATVPAVLARDLDGRTWSLGEANDRPQMLIFTVDGCPACRYLIPSIDHFARSCPDTDILVATDRPAGEAQAGMSFRKAHVLPAPHLASAFRIKRYPYALLLDGDGILRAKGVVNNIEHLESLLPALTKTDDDSEATARPSDGRRSWETENRMGASSLSS